MLPVQLLSFFFLERAQSNWTPLPLHFTRTFRLSPSLPRHHSPPPHPCPIAFPLLLRASPEQLDTLEGEKAHTAFTWFHPHPLPPPHPLHPTPHPVQLLSFFFLERAQSNWTPWRVRKLHTTFTWFHVHERAYKVRASRSLESARRSHASRSHLRQPAIRRTQHATLGVRAHRSNPLG